MKKIASKKKKLSSAVEKKKNSTEINMYVDNAGGSSGKGSGGGNHADCVL